MGHGDYSPTSRHQESQPEHTGNEDTPCAITWLLLGCHTGSSAFPNRPFSFATSNWIPTLAAIDYDVHANILRTYQTVGRAQSPWFCNNKLLRKPSDSALMKPVPGDLW